MKKSIALVLAVLAGPVFAQEAETCPPVVDRAAEKDEIYRDMRIARDETDARILSDGLWRIWLDAPDQRAQILLDQAMQLRRFSDLGGSVALLDALVAYCPDYAEGYNQRAFSYFLQRRFDAALVDLKATLAIDPRHLGAMTGKALTEIGLGDDEAAQQSLREALRLNPWLAERRLLTGPPEQEL